MATPHFWLISGALLFFFFGMFGLLVHIVPLYESIGISREDAALLVSLAALLGMCTRLAIGFVADRIDRFEHVVIAMCGALGAAVIALLLDQGPVGIGVFLLLWVIGTGIGPIIEAVLLTRLFGLANFATILGAVLVVEEVGLVVSPTIAGAIFDRTGSYDLVLVLFAGTFTVSALLFATVLRLPDLRLEAEPADGPHRQSRGGRLVVVAALVQLDEDVAVAEWVHPRAGRRLVLAGDRASGRLHALHGRLDVVDLHPNEVEALTVGVCLA